MNEGVTLHRNAPSHVKVCVWRLEVFTGFAAVKMQSPEELRHDGLRHAGVDIGEVETWGR